jgi:phospholipid transport system substrate-binding protein
MRNLTLITFSILLLTPMTLRAQEAVDEPLKILKENTEKIRELVLNSKTEEEMQGNVKDLMDQFVNFGEFGKLSLGSKWKTLTEDQRKIYLVQFKELLQRTYLRRFKPGKEFEVKYRSETRFNKKKERGEIQTTIISGDVEADVDYRFSNAEGWKVYDMVVDEVSIMRNYRKSFLKILKKDGFEALVEKMKKKTSDAPEE